MKLLSPMTFSSTFMLSYSASAFSFGGVQIADILINNFDSTSSHIYRGVQADFGPSLESPKDCELHVIPNNACSNFTIDFGNLSNTSKTLVNTNSQKSCHIGQWLLHIWQSGRFQHPNPVHQGSNPVIDIFSENYFL